MTTFLFQKSHQLTHFVVPPLPKKLTLFGDPDICFCCKDRDSNRAIRRIETVRWTVSLPAGVPKKALAFNGRIPTSAPSSSQASYRLWRLFLSFYRKSPRAHCAAPPLPKKLTLFGDPDICFCCKDRDSNRAIRRIETVHRTVSAKFINEFGATCLLCFAQFTLI